MASMLFNSVVLGIWYAVLGFVLWDARWIVDMGPYSVHDRVGIVITALMPTVVIVFGWLQRKM